MALDNEVVYEKLLKHGLFPEKLISIFSSENYGNFVFF